MTITTVQNNLAARINAADLNTIADALRAVGLGTILRQLRAALRRQSPNANPVSPYDLATVQTIFLPDDAKAIALDRAYARAGTAGTGEMTVAAANATPTTGQVAVTPAGNIAFLATDAITDVDLDYEPAKQDVVEVTLPVVPGTGVCALPAKLAGVAGSGAGPGTLMVLEAEALIGTTVGKKIVLAPAAGAPATGQARLNVAKSTVQFAVADAVTSARLKLGVCSGTDVNALLEAASPGIL